MKRTLLLVCSIAASSIFAQSWNITGNSATDSSTNFLGTSDAKDLVLKTNNIERIRLNANGVVGITGASADGIALNVSGRALVVSNTLHDTFYVGNDGSNHPGGNSLVFLRYSKYQPNNPGILDVAGWPTSTGYALIMSLKANGKFYLGTNPDAACGDCSEFRMFIKDGIRTEKVKVDVATANGWADYVFDKSYKLKTLEEVEKHIEEKGHLPNIPSTDEVMKNGLNLGEMDAKLLEKIEELTLYSIEQNKQLKTQSEEIKELKKQVQQLLMIKK